MALITQSNLEARLGRSLTSEEVSVFNVANPALQAHVERIIGSSVESASESSRYYDGGVQHLKIDPCTNISSVIQVDDDDTAVYTYDTSDYVTDPKNRTVKTQIRHRNSSGFIRGINNIKVTAKFSIWADEAVRDIVKNALINALVSEVQNSSNIKKESIEGYSVEYVTTEAQSALSPIKYLFPGV